MIVELPQPKDSEPDWVALSKTTGRYVLLAFGLIALVQLLIVGVVAWLSEGGQTTFGISGDFFGLTNAIFSALAFAMIIVTLWMQKYELKLQRDEMADTRAVWEKQQFESTFFSMLNLHNGIVKEIKADGKDLPGRPAFSGFVAEIQAQADGVASKNMARNPPASISVEDYETWYDKNEARVGHYFRTLYNMIRYIDDSDVEDKEYYTRMVRAQLSANELKLLCLNGLGELGKKKFKPLIQRYALLKHLSEDFKKMFADQYEYPAFGKEWKSPSGNATDAQGTTDE